MTDQSIGNQIREHTCQFRVRYSETDAMGYLHHGQYLNYFEVGRVELHRAQGGDYRALEEQGILMVVVRMQCRYLAPARFDDLLTLHTQIVRITRARIDHRYRLYRDEELLTKAESVLGCVDREGRAQTFPDLLS